jgi:hypothetical protein
MLGDVAVRHPQTGIRDVEQDVHGPSRWHKHGVLPHQVGFRLALTRQDEEAPGAMDMERVVHRVIRLHLVNESDLHPVADREGPRDGPILGSALPVDEHPSHVAGLGGTVDLRHEVFPLEPVVLFVLLVLVVNGIFARHGLGRREGVRGHELHAALRAGSRLRRRHLRVHRTGVRGRGLLLGVHREQLHPALRAGSRLG